MAFPAEFRHQLTTIVDEEGHVPTAEQTPGAPTPRDYTALKYLAAFSLVEIALLYLLIAVETPLSPLVRQLLRNPIGVFTLVMIVVTLLCYGMAAILGLRETSAANRRGEPPV